MTVDTKAEAQILLERVAVRKSNGRYYMPKWMCPTVPNDEYANQARVDPEFAQCLGSAGEEIPKVVEKLTHEYAALKRDMAA